jgi:protein O-GlcNAc transferase
VAAPPARRAAANLTGSRLSLTDAATRFDTALALHQRGELTGAEAGYREVLKLDPRHLQAIRHLGIIALQTDRVPGALQRFSEALAIADTDAALHANLAQALVRCGRPQDALASLERALQLEPRFAGAWLAKGELLLDTAQPAEAFDAFTRALHLAGTDPAALNGAGLALLDLDRSDEALALFTRALEQQPGQAVFALNRALAHANLAMPEQALHDCQRARRLGHVTAQLCFVEGNALLDVGRQSEAVAAFDAALALDPRAPKVLNNRGSALVALGQYELALRSFDACLELMPDRSVPLASQARLNRCSCLKELGRSAEALAALEELGHDPPDLDFVPGLLIHMRLAQFDWRDYEAGVAAVLTRIDHGERVDVPLSFLAVADAPAAQLRCARLYVATEIPESPRPKKPRRVRTGRLRVAYLSSDFRAHPVSTLMAGVLELHDRQHFETFAISTGPDDGSELRRRIMEGSDHFLDCAGVQDAAMGARMDELGIHIAVDLNGHTAGARLQLLASRPAPVQVSYLGFPGTVGCDFIDYVIADEFVVPPESSCYFSEKVIYLPECFQANDERRAPAAPCARAATGLPQTGFVFCSFNASHKLNPVIFDIWCRLLRAVPGSVLWLVSPGAAATANLLSEARARGVGAERLVFADRVSYEMHLSRLAHADLFLDTLPFNAGATASDALWAGLPVLTCAGRSFAARMAGSLLHAVDLPELVTGTLDEYERLALALALDPPRLAALRTRLAANRNRAPLFDTRRHCRNLEAAYTEIWERYVRGEVPATIRVR